ncbi:lysylphosphatidylglycerol synthase transmembrane domain-containing protein [Demequina muriae]|uniref:Lysylphosphatidylglycerol synthase transmembrane domain-containing protein n=1 Tax=Demequina muriae TaxID=3051664 RepID=A0ABT8GGA3_9MICO|nr:lysylphosphatidylglycerol synthase transmembrane domain-containing protein [Demequina sp. EGI L300058]MDN4480455.1 lysylphosphatidylglycerol synthase transmembrane domain-containing protein [Demequina sp. EGI L300058]
MAADTSTQETPVPDPLAGVTIHDEPETRVHRVADLIAAIGTTVGIVLVLLLGAYSLETTQGFTEDVRGISRLLQRLLVAPVNIFSGVVTLIVPAAVIIDLAVRREPRRILEVLGAAVLAFIATVVAVITTQEFGADELVASLSVRSDGEFVIQLPAYLAAVSAMLTAAGLRTTRRVLSVSWTLLWIAAAVGIISGIVTLPAAITVVLIGRVTGLVLRWALGSTADRAYGESLVDGIRRAGFEPRTLLRADARGAYEPTDVDAVSAAVGRTRSGRVYSLTTVEGHHLIVNALDGDQHTAGFLAKLWATVRFRGIDTRAEVSLRHTAESTALASHAARTAGVRTARVLGMSQARDTMITVYQRPVASHALCDMEAEDVTDEILDAIWGEVTRAHDAGIAHRALSAQTILVGDDEATGEPMVWLTTWEMGEVAAGRLSRRLDDVQVLAATATLVGAGRAVAAAFRALDEDVLEQVAPLLQSIVLPRETRQAVRSHDKLLQQLRTLIVQRIPHASTDQQNIARFGWRTVLTFGAAVIAGGIVLAGFNAQEVVSALRESNPWWIGGAFLWSLLTFVGAAMAMLAFSPIRLPWFRVVLVQVAAAYVALAVPAGVGPAALNLRTLTKRRVAGPIAVATVALVQVSAIVVTVVGLLVLTLITGSEGTLAALPSTAVLIGVFSVAVVVALALLVPAVRRWAAAKLMPPLRQTWPRLVQVLGQPGRLLLGLGGNFVQTAAYVGAFYCTLQAFGQELAVIDVAVLFFLSNAAGAIVPTPGGLGAVEAALIAGLFSAGISLPVATPVVVIYRLITYWARVPMGYAALKFLQRKGEL